MRKKTYTQKDKYCGSAFAVRVPIELHKKYKKLPKTERKIIQAKVIMNLKRWVGD